MPRRTLLLLTALVLALHWLALVGLPLGPTGKGEPTRMAFHTRMIPPPSSPPAPQPEVAPAPPPPAAPPKRPRRKARPAPPPAPEHVIEPAPAESVVQPAPLEPATETDVSPPEPNAAEEQLSTAPPTEPTTGEQIPAPQPPAPASAEAAPAPAESAGVDIQPPGATGAPASNAPPPVRLPPSTRLSFEVVGEVKKLHYNANAELVWRHDGARYEARQQIRAFLLGGRSQSSVGRITEYGLQPERFGDKSRSEQAAHFNFETHEVIFSANTPRATIGQGAQDRLSVFIQLGAMLAAAPDRYPPGTRITLTTVGARYADRWTFTVEGEETLDLPAGPTPALKLERLPRHDRDQKAELWLGSALGYLPVRIRLTQGNGDFAELSLSGHDAP